MSERSVYFNEIDPVACAVLRETQAGFVDERSIKDVSPDDVKAYRHAHFFAGAGLWAVAAEIARWPLDRPLWTASCPCQGESVAGKRLGADDPRHLWPDLFRLVRACRPAVIVGEQVDRAAGTHWLDGVWSDLEGEGYAFRAVDIPACAVDAPHKRNRIYWVAVANPERIGWPPGRRDHARDERAVAGATGQFSDESAMANAASGRWEKGYGAAPAARHGRFAAPDDGEPLADADRGGHQGRPQSALGEAFRRNAAERPYGGVVYAYGARFEGREDSDRIEGSSAGRPDVERADRRNSRSFWDGAEWLECADGKARRAQPGVRLLAHGLAGRVDLWRLAGNSIVPQLAAEVLGALLETIERA